MSEESRMGLRRKLREDAVTWRLASGQLMEQLRALIAEETCCELLVVGATQFGMYNLERQTG